MHDLPRREREITVEVGEDVTLRMATLSAAETVELLELGESVADAEGTPGYRVPRAELVRRFEPHFRGAKGLTVGGRPLDPSDPEHVAAVPWNVRLRAMVQLFNYAIELPVLIRGNSTAPAERSHGASAPRPASTGAASASS